MAKRKFTALLTALIIFTTVIMPTQIFADKIGKEAKACADLEILIGKDLETGVTSEYLAETPTRIQALIIFLRIQGLEDEALTYDWDDNFKDADNYNWVVGRNYLGYAKDNPHLGWIGNPDGNFYPNNTIDAKAFYKVMLESLDYNQDLDFDYDETLEFAESVGIVASAKNMAKVKDFTIDHVAKAIYSTLNTKPKDENKSLITLMIDKGIIDEGKAAKAGFKIDVAPIEVLSFERLSNNKYAFALDNDTVLEKDDITITPEDSNREIAIDSIISEGNKIIITTAVMPAFAAYELHINMEIPVNGMAIKNYSERFVALPRDTRKPKAVADIISNNIIKITFDEEVDITSAENINNYIVENDIDVYDAELDSTGKVVTLTTAPQREGKRFWLEVRNVTDLAGNPMEFLEKSYVAPPKDTTRPSIINIQSESNKSLVINFSEALNRITAERTENYTVYNDAFTIEDAILDETGKTVRLRTTNQNPDTVYRITVKNIADLADNVMYETTKSFRGASGSSTRFDASTTVISNSEVEITFSRTVEKDSAEDIANYYIDNDLEILDAFLSDNKKTVTLITSNQKHGTKYMLEINDVYDSYGSVLSYAKAYFIGISKDTSPLSYTAKSTENGLVLTFNKRIDKESAENVFNYALDSSLGYAAKATLDKTGKIVTLLTKEPTVGKIYTITVRDVTDLAGVEISTDDKIAKRNYAGYGDTKEKSLKLDAINAYDISSIDLYFDNAITEDELADLEATIVTENDEDYSNPKGLEYQKYFSADKATVRVQFKTDASNNPEVFKSGRRYEVRVSNLDRLDEDSYSNIKSFPGTSQVNEPPYILDVFAENSTAVSVSFSKPVKGISPNQFSISGTSIIGASVKPDEIVSQAMLYLSNSNPLKDDKEYKLTARSGIKDAAGFNSIPTSSNQNTKEFIGTSYKNQAPYVEDIYAINKYTLVVEFNEPMDIPASSGFSIRRSPSGGSAVAVSNIVLSDDKESATIYLNSANAPISADYDYEITLSTAIKDLQGLTVESSDRKIEFAGSDVELPQFEILGESIDIDNKIITLITSNPIKNTSLGMDCFEISGANYGKSSADKVEVKEQTIRIILRNALRSNSTVNIKLTNTGKSTIKDLNNQKITTDEIEVLTY